MALMVCIHCPHDTRIVGCLLACATLMHSSHIIHRHHHHSFYCIIHKSITYLFFDVSLSRYKRKIDEHNPANPR